MTVDLLEQWYWLPKEISLLKETVTQLRAELSQEIMELNRTEYRDSAIKSARSTISLYENQIRICEAQLGEIETFINTIEDPLVRDIIQMRYKLLLSWLQIELRMADKDEWYSADGFRKKVSRYIESTAG